MTRPERRSDPERGPEPGERPNRASQRFDVGLDDRFDVRLDDLPDGVVVADAGGRVVACNAAAARLLGVSGRGLLGQQVADALPFQDAAGNRWWACADPYTGLATRTGWPERALTLPNRHVLVTARFRRELPLGPVTGVVVMMRDAGGRNRQERGGAELVATVAHELRSPLTSVKGFTSTLLAKWDRFTDAQRRLMLETVDADADRVVRLITELLDVARIDSGRLVVRRALVDLSEVARRQVAGLVAAGLPENRVDVRVRRPLPELWADADKVDRILANLLENALRHGAGRVTVAIEAAGDDALALTVSDEGDGIPAELHHHVFRRFWRAGAPGGTGLGLYLVKGLVEAHGGTVELGRADRGGARLRVELPSAVPDALQ